MADKRHDKDSRFVDKKTNVWEFVEPRIGVYENQTTALLYHVKKPIQQQYENQILI